MVRLQTNVHQHTSKYLVFNPQKLKVIKKMQREHLNNKIERAKYKYLKLPNSCISKGYNFFPFNSCKKKTFRETISIMQLWILKPAVWLGFWELCMSFSQTYKVVRLLCRRLWASYHSKGGNSMGDSAAACIPLSHLGYIWLPPSSCTVASLVSSTGLIDLLWQWLCKSEKRKQLR